MTQKLPQTPPVLNAPDLAAPGVPAAQSAPPQDWRRFDLQHYAELGAVWDVALAPSLFQRLDLDASSPVHLRLSVQNERAKPILSLQAQAQAWVECQRCLKPMIENVAVQRSYWFAKSPAEQERWEEELGLEADVDVLLLETFKRPRIDVLVLLEDELIMALPLAPKHESCPDLPEALASILLQEGQADVASPLEVAQARPNPFAVLAKLQKDK